ncbi:pyridoxamine 5'-phosphate oxidase family protein [Nocardia yunnanensis]|uniref:Pyridoxamine 5'-phosphate oxidase family protein n=1 Tax=Nocardia yunnanensis TaxID=2382165 RepID=A0A386Z7R6_9NOCA|nr:pyridoxamine 5'-phosphate oxidase family protein [Nocardia yunnanensis]AYF73691.1 pyridoxamine 5'-phosphate oxidase family protein [Nocardia yunnanensis]
MKAKNLDDSNGMQIQDWESVTAVLDRDIDQGPESGGPSRHTTWLITINADGTPHVTAVGAVWVDGAYWFQTGDTTQKGKNVARDPRCALSVTANEFDLVINGTAEKITDTATVERIAATWAAGGWPCEVDESGKGITAPFNAPATGPAPWYVYRITPRSAVSVSTVAPGGTTRWTF